MVFDPREGFRGWSLIGLTKGGMNCVRYLYFFVLHIYNRYFHLLCVCLRLSVCLSVRVTFLCIFIIYSILCASMCLITCMHIYILSRLSSCVYFLYLYLALHHSCRHCQLHSNSHQLPIPVITFIPFSISLTSTS